MAPNDSVSHTHSVYSIANILIPSEQFVGYVQVRQLHPQIPSDTIIHFKKIGNETFELHESFKLNYDQHGVDLGARIDLGDRFSAKVVKYDPTNDYDFDLELTIMDGDHSGQSGWMNLPLVSADADDGHSIGQFTNAVVPSSVQLPFDCSDIKPRSEAYESGDFAAAFTRSYLRDAQRRNTCWV